MILLLAILALVQSPKGADTFIAKAIVPPPPQARVIPIVYPANAKTNVWWQLEATIDNVNWGVISDFTVSNRVITVQAKGIGYVGYRVRLLDK